MFSADTILQAGGIITVALVIFAETGLLFGFIFPGDSLLLVAGLFASQHKLSIEWLVPAVVLASIIGYQTGYYVGKRFGPRVFSRQDGLFFRREYISKTQDFFNRRGAATVLLARFIPYVRTFVAVVAGIGSMNTRTFAAYNIVGGVLWAGGVTLVGYWLGNTVPNFDKYLVISVVAALVLFHTGAFWHILRNQDRRNRFKQALIEEYNHFFKRKKA